MEEFGVQLVKYWYEIVDNDFNIMGGKIFQGFVIVGDVNVMRWFIKFDVFVDVY